MCREDRPVEHEVGMAHDQEPILLADRLAFGGVDHDDRIATGDRGELDGGGEARATPSAGNPEASISLSSAWRCPREDDGGCMSAR